MPKHRCSSDCHRCAIAARSHDAFGLYMLLLSFFHASEYFTTALFNADKLSNDCKSMLKR